MNNMELKKLLAESYLLESDLHDFCIECLTRIFAKDSDFVISEFNAILNDFANFGGVQSLDFYERMLKDRRKDD